MELTTGQRIRTLRQRIGCTQSDIAERLNISVPAFSKIESGTTDISISRLLQLAQLFEVDPATLLPGSMHDKVIKEELSNKDKIIEGLQKEVMVLQGKLIEAFEKIGA